MSLDDFSNIVVTTGGAALSQVGFGTLLCLVQHDYFADLVKEYTSADDATVNDGVPVDAPLRMMLDAAFAQKPKPKKVKIGKRTLRPTQTITITPIAANSVAYAITLAVDDRTPIVISVTSDGSGTVDEICDLLETAINAAALDEVTVTPTGGATATALVLTVSAGHVLTFSGWNTARLTVTDATPGQTIRFTPLAFNSTLYSVDFYMQGGSGTAEYTSDASATVDEICDGLQAAILALGLPGVTVTPDAGTATYIDVKCTSGRILFFANWDDTRLHIEDRTQDPGVATDLAAIRVADSDWAGLAIDQNANDVIEEAADWAETVDNMLFAYNSSDWMTGDASAHTGGIFYVLKGKSYAQSVGLVNFNDSGAYGGVRMLAERFPHDPGAEEAGGTWAFKTLRGETADNLTSSQKTTLRGDNANVYEVTASVSHTLDGKTASGEFADVIRFLQWFKVRLQERIATVQLTNQRVPYTARGLTMIEAACKAQLKAGLKAGGISEVDEDGNAPTVTVPALSDTDAVDRRARVLPGVKISFQLAGAIHLVDPVNVTASV